MDLSAIISSFAVVVLHTSGSMVSINVNTKSPTAIVAILINIIFAFGVPMFFMQSGANILNYRKRYDTVTFFKKRTKKVIVPFVLWSMVGFILLVLQQNKILNFFKLFFGGNMVGPYWFFYTIIGFYLCAPFLSIVIDYGNKKICLYVLALSLVVNSILPLFSQILQINNGFNLVFPAIGSFLQWFIAGYYIVHYKVKHIKIIYGIGMVALILEVMFTFLATFLMPHNPYYDYTFGGLVKNFYDIQNIFAFLAFSSLFLLLKKCEEKLRSVKFSGAINKLSKYTYGVYLIHPILLMAFVPLFTRFLNFIPMIIRFIVLPLFVYFISIILTIVIKKIPCIGKVMLP